MKSTYARRYRRSPSTSRETSIHKRDNQQEHSFFSSPSRDSFFKPNLAIQRKCASCEGEEKKVNRLAGPAEEEKKIQKTGDKKEEEKGLRADKKEQEKKLQRQPEMKEEEKVMRSDSNEEEKKLQRQPEKKEEEKVMRTEEKKEEEKNIARKDSGAATNGVAATGAYINSLGGKGNALPKEAQHFFGKKMGYDFSNVKIHTGTEAEQSAKNVNAKAYAIENDIVFNKGQYNPSSAEGKKLLAHELTHVVQQRENNHNLLNRVTEDTELEKEKVDSFIVSGRATNTQSKIAYGCAGVNVQGQTEANYTDSFTAAVSPVASTKCTDCEAPDCISADGLIISNFKANPVISLPSVPGGLTECEATAVEKFINTTLKRHEQQHVSAFNTYNGLIKTPYKYMGCRSGLDSYLQSLHDGINAQRQSSANTLSNALDPFNATVSCDCKD
ncbi:MAG: DUF4157 domain-containing protein [Ferruginibacter sp.]